MKGIGYLSCKKIFGSLLEFGVAFILLVVQEDSKSGGIIHYKNLRGGLLFPPAACLMSTLAGGETSFI